MARFSERYSRRVAHWISALVAPALVLLVAFSGGPRFWWEYASLFLWTVLGVNSVYRLITDRKPMPDDSS